MHPTQISNDRTAFTGYSAKVRIELVQNGHLYRPGQIAHDRMLFAEPPRLATGLAELTLWVDDAKQQWTVEILPHDIESCRVPMRHTN